MTTTELIKQLQEADPGGECEVTVGNSPIRFVDSLPGYYDGAQVVKTDKGYKFNRTREKVTIHHTSLHDLVFDNPELEVDCSELSDERRTLTEEFYHQVRKASADFDLEMLLGYFEKWASDKLREKFGDADSEWNVPPRLFAETTDIKPVYPTPWPLYTSVYDFNRQWWDTKFEVGLTDSCGFPEIRVREG